MYGRYMTVSNRTCLNEGNLAITQQSQGSSKESTRTRHMSDDRIFRLDGRGDFEQETHEEIKEFHRKPSFQVMGDYGEIGLEENDDIPRRREPCRDDDDETAKEIQMLMKNQTFSSEKGNQLLENFQRRRNVGSGNGDFDESRTMNSRRRRRSFQRESDDEQAEEIRELMRNQTLSTHEGESRLQRLQSQGNGHRAERQLTSSEKPCEIHRDGLPLNWNRDEVMSHSMFKLIELNKGDPESDQIYQDMEESGLEVVKVERLQNLDSWEKFQSEVKHMARRRNPDDDLNIKYLYHGTSVEKTCICEEGLDQRLSRMGYFGKGIYFSDNPLKCVNYAGSSNAKGESYLLKCRVILGDQKKYRKGEYKTTLKREPEKENPKPGSWKFFDSVMGCPKDYNEYVIYENRRAMIDYIITFKINQLGQSTLRERVPSPIFDNQGRETGFVESQPLKMQFSGNADDHFDRISQVREAIRRKRCEERGQDYIPPDTDKKEQDKAMWDRLQRLHNVDASTLPSLQEKTARMRHAASEPQFQVEDLEGAFTESATNSTMFPHSQSFSLGHDDTDPCDEDVEAVMKSLIVEFREVTSCDNSETARYYIDKCQMNINQAIVCYYEELP